MLLAGCGRLPWQAQSPPKIPRVGWLENGPAPGPGEASRLEDFRQGLRELGYVEGRNVVIERRYGEDRPDLLAERAAELARLPVDIIVAGGPNVSALAARDATRTIPIIMAGGAGDPIGAGLIASYARPGGNVTGLVNFPEGGPGAKHLELLKEVTPGLSKAAWLVGARAGAVGAAPAVLPSSSAAQSLGVEVVPLQVRGPSDLEESLDAARRAGAGALGTAGSPLMIANARRIAAFALEQRWPSISQWRTFAEDGFLMSYGAANPAEMHRRAAYYVDRIVKGADPAALPVEQPMRFEFVVNLKTAQALGLTIPPHVLLQATDVIR